jgi:hypothetical protein
MASPETGLLVSGAGARRGIRAPDFCRAIAQTGCPRPAKREQHARSQCSIVGMMRRRGFYSTRPLFPVIMSLPDRDVAINRQACQALGQATGLWPFDFDPVQLGPLAKAEYHPRVVRGEKTSPAHFHPAALQIASLIRDDGADGINVRLLADQPHAKPVSMAPGIVLQKNWGLVAAGDQNILSRKWTRGSALLLSISAALSALFSASGRWRRLRLASALGIGKGIGGRIDRERLPAEPQYVLPILGAGVWTGFSFHVAS